MNGVLLINKPRGMSSGSVVGKIKKLTGEKCGHMGTLDPLAEGVLPICIGRATRLFNYFLDKTKVYIAQFKFGEETDTLDLEGRVVGTSSKIPTYKEVDDCIFYNFLGARQQLPPEYSAKKIGGKKSYDLARQGKEIDLKPVDIYISRFSIERQIDDKTYEFEIECSSGTYIRALARDLGRSLGSCATMTKLVRTRVGRFDKKNCVDIENLSITTIEENLIPLEDVILSMGLPRLTITNNIVKDLLDGKPFFFDKCGQDIHAVFCDGKAVGFGKVVGDRFKMLTYLL